MEDEASPKKKVHIKASIPQKIKNSRSESNSTTNGSQSSASSYDSQGSEFGDNFSQFDIQKKLPLVQKDIAKMLKLDVSYIFKFILFKHIKKLINFLKIRILIFSKTSSAW